MKNVLVEYDRWHDSVAASEVNQDPLRFPWYQSVADSLPTPLAGRALEVGCGRGDFAIWLAKQYPQLSVTGIDFSTAAIAIARERASASGILVDFQVADVQDLPFPNNHFDYVISCECLEHVPDPSKMCKELVRVLALGGRFALTTENYFNGMIIAWCYCWLRGKPFNSGTGVQPHENFFLFWRVHQKLLRAGAKVDQTKSSHFQWLLLPRVDPAKLCTMSFGSSFANALAKPFGRHYSYFGRKAK